LNLSQDIYADLLAYRRAYHDMNDVEVSLDFIVEQVLMRDMKGGKAFRTWKIKQEKGAAQPRCGQDIESE
jgi:hypothetical protein